MALVVVPWMPHCLTSAPVRGGWQVAATEPYSTQILRATRSVHFQVGTLCDDAFEAAHVDGGQRIGREAADRDRRHLRLGIGAAHRVGIDHRPFQMGRGHEAAHAVGAADLHAHERGEAVADVLLHDRDGAGEGEAVGQPFLADQRRTHVGDGADPVVVGEVGRIHELHAMAVAIERAHVEQRQIGIAAAAGAQHPGADGQRFDVVEREFAQTHANTLLKSMS